MAPNEKPIVAEMLRICIQGKANYSEDGIGALRDHLENKRNHSESFALLSFVLEKVCSI